MAEKMRGEGSPAPETNENEPKGLIGYKGWGGPYRGSKTDAENLAKKVPGGEVVRLSGSIEIRGQQEPAYGVSAPFKPVEGFDVWNPDVTEKKEKEGEE